MEDLTSRLESPFVRELVQAITRYGIRISKLSFDASLEASSLREVELELSEKSYRCLVYNEYGDMDTDNLPLQLNMILMEFETFQDVEDILEWTGEYDLDVSKTGVKDLWDRLQKNASEIRQVLGSDIQPTPSWDLQHGSGDVQVLRDLPVCFARPDLYPYAYEVWFKPDQIYAPQFVQIHAGELCRIKSPDQAVSGFKSYQETQDELLNDGWELAIDTIYPKTQEGIATGQWFEYWVKPDPEAPLLCVLGSTPGEHLAVRTLHPASQPIVEFETYEEAKFALWHDEIKGAIGRMSFDGNISHDTETLSEPERGFRVDKSTLMFAFLLFFGGLIVFDILAAWTGVENFRVGTLLTTIGAIYYFFRAFSSLSKDL